MSKPPATRGNSPPPISDSPWFWAMLFCAFGIVLLLVMFPRYQQRQRRLEMQYKAREEIVRRQAAGEERVRAPGEEGTVAPPELGDLIIPLWPLLTLFSVLLLVSAVMLQRSRRVPSVLDEPRLSGTDGPRGGEP